MTDRELLEFAAKAAGLTYRDDLWDGGHMQRHDGLWMKWRPLEDDGDEARLEGALCLNVSWGMASVTVDSATERYSDHGGDKQKARRRAGVRAAAAIGKEMQ